MPEALEIISDREIVYRLIQPTPEWFDPPDVIKSSSFTLRPADVGVSVFRARLATPEKVREYRHADESYPVAQAAVGEIRNAKNGAGVDLHLDVIRVDVDLPLAGHAEI